MKKVIIGFLMLAMVGLLSAQNYKNEVIMALNTLGLKYGQTETTVHVEYTTTGDRSQRIFLTYYENPSGWGNSRWILLNSPIFEITPATKKEAEEVLFSMLSFTSKKGKPFSVRIEASEGSQEGYICLFAYIDIANINVYTLRNMMELLASEADNVDKTVNNGGDDY